MFDLNETINWKPKALVKDVWNWLKNANDIYRDPDSGEFIAYLENRRQPRRNLGSVEIIQRNWKSIAAGFQIL
jgi:hypothetical protein